MLTSLCSDPMMPKYIFSLSFAWEGQTGIVLYWKPDPFFWTGMRKQALKELRAKASQKGSFGGSGLKKSGKKWSLYIHEACFYQVITDTRVLCNLSVGELTLRLSHNICLLSTLFHFIKKKREENDGFLFKKSSDAIVLLIQDSVWSNLRNCCLSLIEDNISCIDNMKTL